MRVMRVVLYEGSDEAMEKQLGNSMKPGVMHHLATDISIVEIRNEETMREIAAFCLLRSAHETTTHSIEKETK